jgi:hypothetical protein
MDELSAVRADRVLEELPEPSWKNHRGACRAVESCQNPGRTGRSGKSLPNPVRADRFLEELAESGKNLTSS